MKQNKEFMTIESYGCTGAQKKVKQRSQNIRNSLTIRRSNDYH